MTAWARGRRRRHVGVWLCTEASFSLTPILSLLSFSPSDSLSQIVGLGFGFALIFLLWVLVHLQVYGGGEDGFIVGLRRWLRILVVIGLCVGLWVFWWW